MNPEIAAESKRVTRRDFLKLSGLGLLGLMVPPMDLDISTEELESVVVDFEFVVHSTDKDIEGIRPKVEDSDLIVIENIGWRVEDLRFFNDVSRGDVVPEEIMDKKYGSYYTQLLNEISGTNKKVVFADVPENSSLELEWYTVRENHLDFSKSFSDQLKELFTGYRYYADWQRRREDEVIKSLLKEIKRYKDLQENTLVTTNVLVIYGAAHTRLMHILKKDTESNFSFPNNSFVFSYEYEAKRRLWFAEDEKSPKSVKLPDEDLMAHVVLEKIIGNWFYYPNEKYFGNTADLDSWLRSVVSKFDLQEIRGIWEERHSQLKKDDPKGRYVTKEMAYKIAEMMRKKGVDERFIFSGLSTLL